MDETGTSIEHFYAIGVYPNLSCYENGKTALELEQTPDGPRIPKEKLEKDLLSPANTEYYDFSKSFDYPSQATFYWDSETKKARMSSIRPNEPIDLMLYDKTGRQGSVRVKLGENERSESTVTLK